MVSCEYPRSAIIANSLEWSMDPNAFKNQCIGDICLVE
jgi:hypothetical protein